MSFWRPRAFVGHIAVAVLGAMITLIAGLNVSGWTPPSSAVLRVILQRQNLILILGVMITVVSAWQAFYNHRERWVGYASIAERLRTLLAKVEFKSRPGAPQDSADPLYEEFDRILSEISRVEAAAMAKKEPSKDAEDGAGTKRAGRPEGSDATVKAQGVSKDATARQNTPVAAHSGHENPGPDVGKVVPSTKPGNEHDPQPAPIPQPKGKGGAE